MILSLMNICACFFNLHFLIMQFLLCWYSSTCSVGVSLEPVIACLGNGPLCHPLNLVLQSTPFNLWRIHHLSKSNLIVFPNFFISWVAVTERPKLMPHLSLEEWCTYNVKIASFWTNQTGIHCRILITESLCD